MCVNVTYTSFTVRRIWLRSSGGGMEVGRRRRRRLPGAIVVLKNVVLLWSVGQRMGGEITHRLRCGGQRKGEQRVQTVGWWPVTVIGRAPSSREFIVVQKVLFLLQHSRLAWRQRRRFVAGVGGRRAAATARQRLFHFDEKG